MENSKKQHYVSFIFLTCGIIFVSFPLLILLFSSFKPNTEVYTFPFRFFPQHWTLDNYADAWKNNLSRYVWNSIVTSLVPTVTAIIFGLLAAYALAKMKFAGKGLLLKFIVVMMLVPFDILIFPMFQLFKSFHLLDSLAGIMVPGLVSAFGVFLMRQFMLQIPDELIEAARIDGCGLTGILTSVVLPNVTPGIAVLGITTFLYNWNVFTWPFIITTGETNKTLSVGLASMVTSINNFNPGGLLAGGIIMVIPVFILFVFFQKGITQVYMTTGIK
ncbi:carbohydrate ABC transporter permease [Cohnella abietis]|uniref:Sugar ABC transporter permease n=1 Tax=Cohnella abietis TaxID=2507935 RepID=A0A3T1CZD1_9BACL|nr:carbohydrate ABC transporter permease [Cohnella abietis]BBI31178.1 sugar ABC transporter permease [Cohnella abietis]